MQHYRAAATMLIQPKFALIDWVRFYSSDSVVNGRTMTEMAFLCNIQAERSELAHSELRFRSREELTGSLQAAGFAVEHVYGNWHKEPMRGDSPVMVFVARRN